MEKNIELKNVITFLSKFPKMPEYSINDTGILEDFEKKHKKIIDAIKSGQEVGFMDCSNVSMISFSTEHMISLVIGYFGIDVFFNDNDELNKVPELDYSLTKEEVGVPIKCKYSGEYIQLVTVLAKHGNIIFEMKTDYPLRVSFNNGNIGLKVIIAPKVKPKE